MTPKSKRQLAAILFADIVGYTALMQRDEQKASALIRHFQQQLEEKVEVHNGKIVNFYGDGALCTFQIPIDAVRCAMDLQTNFQRVPNVPVRIGIHSGTVIYEGDKIFGDSVNITSRIESMGVAGGILLSKKVRDEVKNNPDLEIQSLGNFEFKNVEEPMEVFTLGNDGFPVPKRAEMKGKLKAKKQKGIRWQMPTLIISLLAIAIFFWFNHKNSSSAIKEIPSIAVLPFDDMSPNKDQAYFGDGIAEEILNTLAQLEELKVAGRTSSFSFKEKEATIAEIGKTLNVNHVLEGSVRKQGDKIRITAQLIKVEDGFHVWSEKYDRDFEDIFAIQDELAKNIGEVLLEKLAPEQIAILTKEVYQNSEAYELFLKAKHIHFNRFSVTFNIEDFKDAEELFLKAIALDSSYALAHAGLADLYDSHTSGFGTLLRDSVEIKHYEDLKLKESKIALQLNPNLSYVQGVRGFCLRNQRFGVSDHEGAFKHFLRAYELDPNDGEILVGLTSFYERKNLVTDVIQFSDRALELNPISPLLYFQRVHFLESISDFESAIEAGNSALDLDPDHLQVLEVLAKSYFYLDKKEEALAVYQKIQGIDSSFITKRLHLKVQLALINGDTAKAKSINPNSWDFLYFIGDTTKLENLILKAYEGIKKSRDYELYGLYHTISNSTASEILKHKPAFQEILKKEKEKHDRFLKTYPRAHEILKAPQRGSRGKFGIQPISCRIKKRMILNFA